MYYLVQKRYMLIGFACFLFHYLNKVEYVYTPLDLIFH